MAAGAALARSRGHPLAHLDLSDCAIGDVGALELTEALSGAGGEPLLLALRGCRLSAPAAACCAAAAAVGGGLLELQL